MKSRVVALCALVLTSSLTSVQEGAAASPSSIRIVVVTAAGGSYDLAARVLARHLPRHLPGSPNIVVENMPGASGLVASNYIYNTGPQDGSVIGAVHPVTILFQQIFGDTNARFDAREFKWVGALSDVNNVLAVWHRSPALDWQEATRKVVTIGASGPQGADAVSARLANLVIGTKFKVVAGYSGGNAITLGMERGEVDGRGIQTWAGWKSTRPEWVASKKVIPLFQVASRPDPELAGVPLLADLTQDPLAKRAVRLFSDVMDLGRPFLVGPGVPADIVAAYRKGFDDTVADPGFIRDMQTAGAEIAPMAGIHVQKTVSEVIAADPKAIARLREAVFATN